MKINLYLCYIYLIITFIGIFTTLFVKEHNNNYPDNIIKLINNKDQLNEHFLNSITIKDKDFRISYIKKKSDKNLDLSISNFTLDSDNKLKYNYEALFKNNFINISSQKYFNDLKFIFSNKELKNEEITKIFKLEIEDNVIKYLIRGDHILNCIVIYITNKKVKKCEKNYHVKLNNFDLDDEIFRDFNYFYFKIDNQNFEFNDKQF